MRHVAVAFIFVYAVVVGGTLALNAQSVFARPVVEQGDIASNALAIRDAKSFDRITGNFSRFGFAHPGPFFLYVYAAGEYAFFDVLGLVPSQHNAHVIAGVLLQAGFFALSVALIAYWVRSALFPPLALLLCSIYFAVLNAAPVSEQLRGSLFISIWPPHWVMFPTLCFLAACASLAAGQAMALPIAAFCGAAIVHGYINTPIYIAPIFILSYVLFHCSRRSFFGESASGAVRKHLRLHVLTAAVLALFIAPILIDMALGAESNFARILKVMNLLEGEPHPMMDVIPFILNYFTFLSHGMMNLQETGSSPWEYLASQWPLLLFWVVSPLVIGLGALHYRSRIGGQAAMHIFYSLLVASGWLLIAVYGARGIFGELYFYICYHVFAVPILLLLLLGATLVRYVPTRLSDSRLVILTLLALISVLPLIPQYRDSMSGYNWRLDRRESLGPVRDLQLAVQKALAASPRRPNLVILDFQTKNSKGVITEMPIPAIGMGPSIGVLLERAGIPFLANSERGAFFGETRVLGSKSAPTPAGDYVVWRVLPIAEGGEEAIPLGQDLVLVVSKSKAITGHD